MLKFNPWKYSASLQGWELGACSYYRGGDFSYVFVQLIRYLKNGIPIIIQADGTRKREVFAELRSRAESDEIKALIALVESFEN